jgi:hypothetical protein
MKDIGLIRIAIREHGKDEVRFYVAQTDTMDGARLVLTARRAVLDSDPALYEALRAAMKAHVDRILKDLGLRSDYWTASKAPGHEREQ